MKVRLVFGLLVFGACTKSTTPPSTPPADVAPTADTNPTEPTTSEPLDLQPELSAVEQNMLELDFVVRFDVQSSGAVQSRLVGELRSVGDDVLLSAKGKFGDQVVELHLHGDGTTLEGSSGPAKLNLPQPTALKEALVIGLTRMGILHNLAVLISARPPDHSDGGVSEWAQAETVVPGANVGPEQPTEDARQSSPEAMSFGLMVEGTEAGDVTLWWDPATKLPVERHQVVQFPEGEMVVRETYTISPLAPAG